MKKVYCAKDPLMIGHLRNVLAAHSIDSITRKLDLATGAGELPPTECWPELWIMDDGKLSDAKAILKKTLAPVEAVRKPWSCAGCGEEIEGQFTQCWQCSRERDLGSPQFAQIARVSGSGRHR